MHALKALLKISFLASILVFLPIANTALARTRADAVVDLTSRKFLSFTRASTKIKPASLTKLMTMYITFEKLSKGHIKLSQKFTVSQAASDAPACKLGLRAGEKVRVSDLLSSLAVCSANDSAKTIAENICTSEENFAKLMNSKAKELGMKRTNFCNASGLNHPRHFSTVRDLSKLAVAVLSFKQYRHFFASNSFCFKGRTYSNTNTLLKTMPGSYGLKTGFTKASGYNLIVVCKRGQRDLMGIVVGEKSPQRRESKMVAILEKVFGKFSRKKSLACTSPANKARSTPQPSRRPAKLRSISRECSTLRLSSA